MSYWYMYEHGSALNLPSFYSRPKIVPASWHTLKLIVSVEGNTVYSGATLVIQNLVYPDLLKTSKYISMHVRKAPVSITFRDEATVL
jgi:hypothetical protein